MVCLELVCRPAIIGSMLRLASGLACLAGLSACASPSTPSSDLLVVGRVYTLAWGEPGTGGTPAPNAPHDDSGWHPDAEAVLIQDGRITYVGTAAEARALAPAGTPTLDATGQTVIPGLIESHTHIVRLGENLNQVRLVDVATEAEIVGMVAARARTVPPGQWILGHGWDEGADRAL